LHAKGAIGDGGDALAEVEMLIRAAALCVACLVEGSGCSAEDVEMALRVLIRARSAEPAPACHSCRRGMPAFRAARPTR